MRIGEFAKKHNVSIDAVRHYIAEGLLTPVKENSQFVFSTIDEDVLESILLLKSMNFKLGEMKSYLLFQTLYTENLFSFMGGFEKEFQKKFQENEREINKLMQMNAQIKKHLYHDKTITVKRGIPLKLLSKLACPQCGINLELNSPKLLHNEIITGTMSCPKCKRLYDIRYGYLSDEPIGDMEQLENLNDLLKQYVEQNDDEYIVKIRELFTQTASCVKRRSKDAKNILIDGQSSDFLNVSIMRMIPKDCTLFIYSNGNVGMKMVQEALLPENSICYVGKRENMPFKVEMDYIFMQDMDIDYYRYHKFQGYPNVSKNARLDCFKVLIMNDTSPLLSESNYIETMQRYEWKKIDEIKTGMLVNKKDSTDLTVFNKQEDIEMQYAIYSFVNQKKLE